MQTSCRTVHRSPARSPISFTLGVGLLALTVQTQAGWQVAPDSLAWLAGTNVLWRFNFAGTEGKPFFHPLSAQGGKVLTEARPADHPWHYGLWFSWKYLNGVNYWEQDRQTGKAAGVTRWVPPVIQTNADGSATVNLALEYVHPSGQVELREQRDLVISAVAADGSYTIDWTATFRAGTNSVKLERTPMPGEPGGQVNGGYAGLSLRLAPAPVKVSLVTERGTVTEFASNRARPDARALACNQSLDERALGGVAILSHPSNLQDQSPWYAVVSDQMRFYCAAILAPKPLVLHSGESLCLRYRIIVRPEPWTQETLAKTLETWKPAK
jgi:hypothetical protein